MFARPRPQVILQPSTPLSPRQLAFRRLTGALESCGEQLGLTVAALASIDDSLADELQRPLGRGAWALLGHRAKHLGHGRLIAARQHIEVLASCNRQFQSAVDLMVSAEALLEEATCEVAEQCVRTHIEACRDSLVAVGALVAGLQPQPAASHAA